MYTVMQVSCVDDPEIYPLQIIFSTLPIQPPTSSSETPTTEQMSDTQATDLQAPPGMSEAALKRIRGDSPLEPNKLEQACV